MYALKLDIQFAIFAIKMGNRFRRKKYNYISVYFYTSSKQESQSKNTKTIWLSLISYKVISNRFFYTILILLIYEEHMNFFDFKLFELFAY